MAMPRKDSPAQPLRYREPREVIFEWMEFYLKVHQRVPTVRELAENTHVSRSRTGEYRKMFIASQETANKA